MIEEFSWKNEQGLRIYAVDWRIEQPRAVVGLIHGLGEHCRRYDYVAEFLNEHGFAVVGYDRQGFGRSEGRKGYAPGYRNYLDGVAQLMVQCERRYPATPVFLYGHSMGGQLLLHYLIQRKPAIRGAIVSAPHIAEAFRPNPVIVALGKVMRKLRPTFTLSNQLEVEALSRDPAVVADYLADPFNHDRLSSQTGVDVLERAESLRNYSAGLSVPVLLIHGSADRITSYADSAAFAERNGPSVTFKGYDGLYHELHHEPERELVLNDLLSWLEERLDISAVKGAS